MTNLRLKSLLCTLPITIIPALLGTTSYLVEQLTLHIHQLLSWAYHDHEFALKHPNDHISIKGQTVGGVDPIFLLRRIKDTSLGVYDSYMSFMIAMITLHLMILMISIATKYLKKKSDQPHLSLKQSQGLKRHSSEECPGETSFFSELKRAVMDFSLLMIQYSAIYCVLMLSCIALQYLVHSRLYVTSNQRWSIEIQDQIGNLAQTSSEYSLQTPQESLNYLNLSRHHKTERMLDLQADSDDVVVYQGMASIIGGYKNVALLNEDEVVLFGDMNYTMVNISNKTSPIAIGLPINYSLEDGPFQYHALSPNGKNFFYSKTPYFYIGDLSDPLVSITLNYEDTNSGYYPPTKAVFCSDGLTGFFLTSELFYFEVFTGNTTKLMSFSDLSSSTAMTLSHDGQTLYLSGDFTGGLTVIHIINITKPLQAYIMHNISLSDSVESMILSLDDSILFVPVLTEIKLFNVSMPLVFDPEVLPSLKTGYYGEDIALTPDGYTLICSSQQGVGATIYDISDLTNPIQFLAPRFVPNSNLVFSFDSRYGLMQSPNTFMIFSILVNTRLEDQQCLNMNELVVEKLSNEASNHRGIFSPDGKSLYKLNQTYMEIIPISDEAVMTNQTTEIDVSERHFYNDPTMSQVVLSPDKEIAFVGVQMQILILNITNKSLVSVVDINNTTLSFFDVLPNMQNLIIAAQDLNNLFSVNISNLASPGKLEALFPVNKSMRIFATNGAILAIRPDNESLQIYDISNMALKPLIPDTQIVTDTGARTFSLTICPDNTTVLIGNFYYGKYGQKSTYTLTPVDISDPTSVQVFETVEVPCLILCEKDILVSPDSKTAFVRSVAAIFVIDISEKKYPAIIGTMPSTLR